PDAPASYGEANANAEPHVSEPELDPKGAFSFNGATFRVRFNKAIARPEAKPSEKGPVRAAPDTLTIVPDAPRTAVWIDDRTLEFAGNARFDETTSYLVTLGALKTKTGEAVAPWKAAFTATPSFIVAGKELGYVPKIGEERVIAIHPSDSDIAPNP